MVAELARIEVLSLHECLEGWLRGTIPQSGAGLNRLEQALADDFYVIHPSGDMGSRQDVLRAFGSAYGTKGRDYRLQIERIALQAVAPDLILVTYRETHHTEPKRARVSTALLRHEHGNGTFRWLFLQETLIATQ